MKQDYKGYEIYFNENTDTWDLVDTKDSETLCSDRSLRTIKSYVDKLVKKGFKKIPVYFRRYGDTLYEGEITSITPGGDIWISYVDNRRYGFDKKAHEKIHVYHSSDVLKKNKKNIEIFNKIRNINGEIEKLEEKKKKFDELLEILYI